MQITKIQNDNTSKDIHTDFNTCFSRLLLGDCLIEMQNIPDKSIDAIICDLPYGTTRAKWDSILDLDLLWKQYERVIKPNGAIVLFASQPFTTTLINSNIKYFKYSLVWDKKMKVGMMNCKRMPLRQHEDIILFYKKQPTYNPQMTKGKMRNKKIEPTKDFEVYGQIKPIDNFNDDYYPSSILEFTNANQKDKEHTTQKPLSLMEYLVKTYTNEGDTVLDNTMGSGTCGVACKNFDRSFIGIEKDENYFKIAEKRINDHTLFS